MSHGLCNSLLAVAFVSGHKGACSKVARLLNVPTENILGLAAQESQYGQGRIASELNNYFSLHAPAPYQIGEEAAHGNPNVKVAKFSSFDQCAASFAERYGSAVRGKQDPREFAQALVRCGFNSGNASSGGRDGFVKYVVNIISAVKGRMSC